MSRPLKKKEPPKRKVIKEYKPKVAKNKAQTIAELRSRHLYCILPSEMFRAYVRSPGYTHVEGSEFKSIATGKSVTAEGHCDFPGDPICGHLARSDEMLAEALREELTHQQEVAGQ